MPESFFLQHTRYRQKAAGTEPGLRTQQVRFGGFPHQANLDGFLMPKPPILIPA